MIRGKLVKEMKHCVKKLRLVSKLFSRQFNPRIRKGAFDGQSATISNQVTLNNDDNNRVECKSAGIISQQLVVAIVCLMYVCLV